MRLFTSDPHIDHSMVSRLRGFESTEAHNEALRKAWCGAVHKGDDVWVLGDVAMKFTPHVAEFIESLPGRKHLIIGNHDSSHPMHRDSHKWQRKYLEVFASVQPFARCRIEGDEFLMSHFPYHNDRGEARYNQYRLRDEGVWLLHGHTHMPEKINGYEIHVGVDAWDLAPVPESTIIAMRREAEASAEVQPV